MGMRTRGRHGTTLGRVRRLVVGVMTLAFLGATQIPAPPASAVPPILPPDFEYTLVTNVSGPMGFDWTPDGRMLIPTKAGQLHVFDGVLNPTPALDLGPVMCTNGERAIGDVRVDPNFPANHFIYLYYTYDKPGNGACLEDEVNGPVNRLSRFVLPDTNVIDPASEVVLFDTPPLYRDHHNGGDLEIGHDGNLWVTVGDGGARTLGYPQDPGRLLGKIVRLTIPNGGIPADNPNTGAGTARCNVDGVPPAGSPPGTVCQEMVALGLRNPFRFAFDPNISGTRFYVNDVGQHTWEEISEGGVPPAGLLGADYGWPEREGPCPKDLTTNCAPTPPQYTDPIHWYGHGPDGAAATGGAFVPDDIGWPASLAGTYLFADYVFGKIYQLVPGGPECRDCNPPTSGFNQVEWVTAPRVVTMGFGPDDCLYYATREDSEIGKICHTGGGNRPPTAQATANPAYGPVPLDVQFDGTGSTDPDEDPLTYEWDFEDDGTPDSTDPSPLHTYPTAGTFFARLTVDDGQGGADSTIVRVDPGNTPPVPVVESPPDGTMFAVGDVFTLTGSANDAEDGGPVPDSALTWEVRQHHATHWHPFLDPTAGNNMTLQPAPEPEDFLAATNSHLEILLTATDSTGLSQTVSQLVLPKKVDLTFETDPPGLDVILDGTVITAPSTEVSWEAHSLQVEAPDQTDASGDTWEFVSWSDGGAQSHTITVPAAPATYTATFQQTQTSVLRFNPTDDAYVKERKPDNNYDGPEVKVDGPTSIKDGLWEFDVTGVGTRTVESAIMNLYVINGSDYGGAYSGVVGGAGFDETTVTWATAPPSDGVIVDTLLRVERGSWVQVDVTPLVTGDGLAVVRASSISPNSVGIADRLSANPPELVVTVGGPAVPDDEDPTSPSNLGATAVSSGQVDLTWDAATDNVGVTGYDIFRNGAEIDSIGPVTGYSDTTAAPESTYTYEVRARDAAGNTSGFSNPATVTTPAPEPIVTLIPTDDAYVKLTRPDRNYGLRTALEADLSSRKDVIMKFDLSTLGPGTVVSAVLRLHCVDGSSGTGAISTTSDAWDQGTVTWNTRPAPDPGTVASLGPVDPGITYEVDVTSAVTSAAAADGTLSLYMTWSSSNGADFAATENSLANGPELVITLA